MSGSKDFVQRVEQKVRSQILSQRVGFLLGAGSSYLNGTGYPLATQLWTAIHPYIPDPERIDIQAKLDQGAAGIEQALDLIDRGGVEDSQHRFLVAEAIARHFSSKQVPLGFHQRFVWQLSRSNEQHVTVFSLNYDPLIERAGEASRVRILDGFYGHESAYFDAASFNYDIAVLQRGTRGGAKRRQIEPWIWLVKLHGSLGWYATEELGERRTAFDAELLPGAKRLMVPPQHRKAQDIVHRPYSTLWSEFRSRLVHQPYLNRLVAVGYGMMDEHVNDVIESALARTNFTLIIVAKALSDSAFDRWSQKRNVLVVTEERCSLNGELGRGHPRLWSFEGLVEEMER